MSIESALDQVEWTPLGRDPENEGSGMPFATHVGLLKIGDFQFHVYRLSDGQRVVDADDSEALFNVGEPTE